ncbi:AIF_HP2_G0002090.mRNA.1.CDS.1 [Saccharomyces cerevisiae]|nr:AIF_HP2_G0002090.mRNA.1.CDS.1 [Saccharomyces cerevisiae]CAI6388254.1 AIF_HP2_G0002090.mRNA.1.CDS.1 [Saccharomyces cerevisiae]CAI6391349.1 AIF_HP1_G0001930.mRNA.1.CDS.1 [Saccharomyces cerevisiae]
MNVTSLVKSWPIMRKVAPVVDLSKICSLVEGNCEFFFAIFSFPSLTKAESTSNHPICGPLLLLIPIVFSRLRLLQTFCQNIAQ